MRKIIRKSAGVIAGCILAVTNLAAPSLAFAESMAESPEIPGVYADAVESLAEDVLEDPGAAASGEAENMEAAPEIDTSAYDGIDFSSCRLIVGTGEGSLIDMEHVLSEYNGVYLLQYGTPEETKIAYAMMYDTVEFIDVDAEVVAAGDVAGTDGMTGDENPLTELAEELALDPSYVGSSGRVIALIDTGVPEGPNVIDRVSMIGDSVGDDHGHGTAMMAAILAQDPDARILSIKALGADGKGSISSVYAGIEYAMERGANVIDLSLSAYSTAENAALVDAVDRAVASGILVIGAAGNNGKNVRYYTPGNIPSAIIAGACDENGVRLASSNFGDTVDYNVVASSTSEAAARLAGYITAHLDDSQSVNLAVNENGLIFSTDYEPAETEAPVAEGDKTISVYYNFYDSQGTFDGGIIGFTGYIVNGQVADGMISAVVNPAPQYMDFTETDGYPRVYINFMSPAPDEVDITSECVYDPETGIVYIPAIYKEEALTVKALLSDKSWGYYWLVPDDLKTTEPDSRFAAADGGWNGSMPGYESSAIWTPKGCNVVQIKGDLSKYSKGQQFNNVQALIAVTDDQNYLWESVAGMKDAYYAASKVGNASHFGWVVSIYECPDAPEFINIGGAGGDKTIVVKKKGGSSYNVNMKDYNWMFANCVGAQTSGLPYSNNGKIIITNKETASDGTVTLTCYAAFEVPTSQDVGLYFKVSAKPEKGKLTLKKTSADTARTNGNSAYSLVGTEYTIYSDAACTKEVGKLTVADEAGNTNTLENLDAGKYWYKETKAGKGYDMNPFNADTDFVTVESGKTATITVSDKPSVGSAKLKKTSANTTITNGNKCYSLNGTEYTVYSDEACTKEAGKLTVADNGETNTLSLNAGDYWYKETKTGKGYKADASANTPVKFTVESGKTTELSASDEPLNDPAAIVIEKRGSDKENAPTLEGTQFSITHYPAYYDSISDIPDGAEHRTWVLEVKKNSKGIYRALLHKDYLVAEKSDPLYTDLDNAVVPLGTIVIREVKAASGYLNNPEFFNKDGSIGTTVLAQIRDENSAAVLRTANGTELDEDGFYAVDDLVPSIGTTLTNPEGGKLARAKKDVKLIDVVDYHDFKAYVGKNVTFDGKLLDKTTQEVVATSSSTVEIGEADGSVEIEFTLDASKLGGHDVVAYETALNEKGKEIAKHENIEDEGQTVHIPKIGTKATDSKTLSNISYVEEEITIIDTVSFENLEAGKTYYFTAKLMTVDDDGNAVPATDKDGKEIVSDPLEYKATEASGTVDVPVTFKVAKTMAGKKVVAYETCSEDKEGKTVYAVHNSIKDENQTVYFPKIGTKVVDKDSRTRNAMAGKVTLVDTISYENLIAGRTYVAEGTLMDRKTGTAITDVNGKTVTVTADFTPEGTGIVSGETKVSFSIDATGFEGRDLVVYEKVYLKDVEKDGKTENVLVATHENIEDEGQTIHFPGIRTTANDTTGGKAPGKNTEAAENVEITDTVTYTNLLPNKKYVLRGVLVDKATGLPIRKTTAETAESDTASTAETAESTVSAWDGVITEDMVSSSKEFTTPEAADGAKTVSGSVNIVFTIDASMLAGKTIVVFEKLLVEEKEVAIHADINDEDQTIFVPSGKTTLVEKESQLHEAMAQEKLTLVDTVEYHNLIPKKEYKVTGTLMDKETEEALVVDGKPVTNTVTFTPDEADGTVDVPFEFNASALEGKTVVAFEKMFLNEKEIFAHEKIDDEGQTVTFPKIGTTAKDKADGDKTLANTGSVTVVDTVEYHNLVPDKTYTLVATLMDKASKSPVKVGDNVVAKGFEFTPKESDGTQDVELTFDVSNVSSGDLVVFEKLYDTETKAQVASHEDYDDKEQTVTVPPRPTPTTPPSTPPGVQTGDNDILPIALAIGAAALVAGILLGIIRKRRRA